MPFAPKESACNQHVHSLRKTTSTAPAGARPKESHEAKQGTDLAVPIHVHPRSLWGFERFEYGHCSSGALRRADSRSAVSSDNGGDPRWATRCRQAGAHHPGEAGHRGRADSPCRGGSASRRSSVGRGCSPGSGGGSRAGAPRRRGGSGDASSSGEGCGSQAGPSQGYANDRCHQSSTHLGPTTG